MAYDVIVTKITNSRARPVVARHLAADPAISLVKANSMLDTLPVPYLRGVPEKTATEAVMHLRKIGVEAQVRETEVNKEEPQHKPIEPHAPKKVTPRPSPTAGSPRSHQQHIGRISQPPPPDPKGSTAQYWVLVFAIAVFAIAVYIGTRGDRFSSKKTSSLKMSDRRQSASAAKPRSKRDKTRPPASAPQSGTLSIPTSRGNTTPTSPQKKESKHYADSARTAPNPGSAIAFYKIAISFNQYNIDAWYGLVGAYRELGMYDHARDARAEMRKIFGENVSSLKEIVGLFGKALELSLTQDRVLRVEYRSHLREETGIPREAFRMIRALRTECQCEAVSLHAHLFGGKAALVYHEGNVFPASRAHFEEQANITYLR